MDPVLVMCDALKLRTAAVLPARLKAKWYLKRYS